jgi:hypothetical protein
MDSVSNSGPLDYVYSRPPIRPDHLPESICWNQVDCATYINGCKNPAKVATHLILINPDGTLGDLQLYTTVNHSVCMHRNKLLEVAQTDASYKSSDGKRTWKWIFQRFPNAVTAVIRKLELAHPILQLCAGNWKAQRFLI